MIWQIVVGLVIKHCLCLELLEHRFADGAELHSALLDLRGQLGRSHNVLAGGEVTRMTPGLQQQRFPLAPSGGSGGGGQRPPLQPPPLGAPSPAPVAQFA